MDSSARLIDGAGFLTQGGVKVFDPARKGHALAAYNDAVEIAPLFGIDGIAAMDVLGNVGAVKYGKLGHDRSPCAVSKLNWAALCRNLYFRLTWIT